MLEALTYEKMMRKLEDRYEEQKKGIGILFARPTSKFVKDEILHSINFFHHSSGKIVDFFLPGYGAYWYNAYPDAIDVCKIDNVNWSFSDKMFCDFISDIGIISKWKYSGNTVEKQS